MNFLRQGQVVFRNLFEWVDTQKVYLSGCQVVIFFAEAFEEGRDGR